MRINQLKHGLLATLAAAVLVTTPGQAAVISYFLDQSNELDDGINYLQVTISDERESGVIDFTVQALQPLLDLAGDKFGIQKFAFNVLGGVGMEARDVEGLPSGWRARNGGRMDGFGLFDITVQGSGNGRHFFGHGGYGKHKGRGTPQDPLTFSIEGVDLDTVLSYVDLSSGRSPQGFSLFSAQVVGLDLGNCGGNVTPSTYGGGGHGGHHKCVTSAYFGGTSAVPAPPAVWLLGTAVAAVAVRRFRKANAA